MNRSALDSIRCDVNAALLVITVIVATLAGCADTDNGGSSGTALQTMTASWDTSTDAQSKALLDQMTIKDHFILEYIGGSPLKEAVFRRACSINPSISWSYDATGLVQNCTTSNAQWQECIDYFGLASCRQNIDLGLGDVQIYFRCESGELDAQTCATYRGLSAQIDASVAATTDTIVRNTGDQCRVGVDPNCYP